VLLPPDMHRCVIPLHTLNTVCISVRQPSAQSHSEVFPMIALTATMIPKSAAAGRLCQCHRLHHRSRHHRRRHRFATTAATASATIADAATGASASTAAANAAAADATVT
jgi:hypothetical protein